MQSNDTIIARKELSKKFKSLRIAHGVTQMNIMINSGLNYETISRLEKGNKPWIIDSQISYLRSLKYLIETSKNYRQKVEKFKLPSIAEIDYLMLNTPV